MEVINIDSSQEHHQADGKDLHTKAQAWRQAQDIITNTRIEHNEHSNDKLELDAHAGNIVSSNTEAEHNTQEDTHTTQYGDRHLIEFTRIRIVNNVFQCGNLH